MKKVYNIGTWWSPLTSQCLSQPPYGPGPSSEMPFEWHFASGLIMACFYMVTRSAPHTHVLLRLYRILYDFLVTIKAAPHECVIRTGLP